MHHRDAMPGRRLLPCRPASAPSTGTRRGACMNVARNPGQIDFESPRCQVDRVIGRAKLLLILAARAFGLQGASPSRSSRVRVWILLQGVASPVALLPLIGVTPALGQQEYSRPTSSAPQPKDIGSDYQLPAVQYAAPRSAWWYWADVLLLSVALVTAALVGHRWRPRR